MISLKAKIKQRRNILAPILFFKSLAYKILWLFPILHKSYFPLYKRISLDIMEACNLSCFNCEASCRHAPSGNYMTLEQINKFFKESVQLGWKWEVITLRGGEPTLHPNFFDILKIIEEYKRLHPKCQIHITTNAFGDKTKKILSMIPDWLVYDNFYDYNSNNVNLIYSSYNVAPADLFPFKYFANFTKGCWRTECCGLGLSRHGYYPCAPGASVDRVFGFDLGIKELAKVSDENLRRQMDVLCRYCGHYKEPNELVLTEKLSKSWKKAYVKYKKERPQLSIY